MCSWLVLRLLGMTWVSFCPLTVLFTVLTLAEGILLSDTQWLSPLPAGPKAGRTQIQ